MRKPTREKKPWNTECTLSFISGSLFPVVIILYLYARNLAYLSAGLALLLSAALLFVSCALWLIVYWLFRSPLSALLFCIICWVVCFASNALILYIFAPLGITTKRTFLSIGLAACLGCVAAFFTRKRSVKPLFIRFFAALLAVLTVVNLFPVVLAATHQTAANDKNAVIKSEFLCEDDKPSPNVYWFHCDGMLGFDAVQKYYGDDQQAFLNALAERGFAVNPSAHFESGHRTSNAIPILMCPYAYDSWIHEAVSTHEAAMIAQEDTVWPYWLDYARLNNELQKAYEQKQYFSNLIGNPSPYFYPTTDTYYASSMEERDREVFIPKASDDSEMQLFINVGQMQVFLAQVSPTLSRIYEFVTGFAAKLNAKLTNRNVIITKKYTFFGDTQPYATEMTAAQIQAVLMQDENALPAVVEPEKQYRQMVEALYEITQKETPAPKFTIVFDLIAHYPFYHGENGEVFPDKRGESNVLDYYPQHVWSSKVLINMIDMILSADPDAVIVLQADHGLHGNSESDFKSAFGTDANALELWNSVISAMRVPEALQNGEEHYAMENPLNISRYLINRFVGKNYDYLPPSEPLY